MRENSFPLSHAICCPARTRTWIHLADSWAKIRCVANYTTGQFKLSNQYVKELKTKNPEPCVGSGLYLVTFNSILTYTQIRTINLNTRIPAISKLRLANNDHMFINCSHCFYFNLFSNNYYKLSKSFLIDKLFTNFFLWSQQGSNLWPPDYESGATNQLSYRTVRS